MYLSKKDIEYYSIIHRRDSIAVAKIPELKNREEEHQEILQAIALFLKNGGVIQKLPDQIADDDMHIIGYKYGDYEKMFGSVYKTVWKETGVVRKGEINGY